MTQRIPLTIGRARTQSGLFVVVDDEDFERASSFGWRVFLSPWGRVYAVSGKATFLHRYLLDAQKGFEVEHLNMDGLDCRRKNMLLLSHSQHLSRQASRLIRSARPTTSKYKGVSSIAPEGPWRATISVDGHQRYLGRFDDEEAAARAYDAASLCVFGVGRTNFAEEEAGRAVDRESRRFRGEYGYLNFADPAISTSLVEEI